MLENETILNISLVVLLLLNLGLSIYTLTQQNQQSKQSQQPDRITTKEKWSNGFGWNSNSKVIANPSARYLKPTAELGDDVGQYTYAGCNCSREGIKTNLNAPFNDDSFLYKDSIYQHY